MKTNHLVTSLLVLILAFVLSGCAGMSTKNTSELSCTTVDINAMLESGDYQKKVDNFIIIQDATSSMNKKEWPSGSGPSRLAISKGLLRCLNNTLPENFDVYAGMRIFGSLSSENGLVYGMSWYSKAGLEEGVLAVKETGSKTDLSDGINDASSDLKQVSGKTAVIIFSDGGKSNDIDPVAAAASMKEMYGENVCIYTVLLGDDPNGKTILEQIAAEGRCGFATEAKNLYMRPLTECDTLNEGKGMGDFAASVFLEKYQPPPPPKCVLDSDGDGVVDCYDKCPDTPKGIKVDKDGCPIPLKEKVSITLLVEFDFDKAAVKPLFHEDIERVANMLIAYPKTSAELEGHTDYINTEEYNMKLSRLRAESVKKYLVEKFGIDDSRITTVGYGESMPIDTNETDEGRQRNRRVVANIEAVIEE
jgi:OOP family OmpA-OmpF porin